MKMNPKYVKRRTVAKVFIGQAITLLYAFIFIWGIMR